MVSASLTIHGATERSPAGDGEGGLLSASPAALPCDMFTPPHTLGGQLAFPSSPTSSAFLSDRSLKMGVAMTGGRDPRDIKVASVGNLGGGDLPTCDISSYIDNL